MYNLEIFTDQFAYVAFDFVDERQTVDLDYLAYNSYTVTTRIIEAKKGYFVRLTRDNEHVASGYIADVQPGKTTQDIQIKPLQTLFDAEVFYTPVTDCITWLATNIQAAFMNNTDTLQNRPITLTYTASGTDLPLTGFNLHKTVNILSVIMSALKTYGVVCDMSLDVTAKKILVDIKQQTATQTIEANLENVLEKSVTLGDSYGSLNKMIIRKTDRDTGANLGESTFYLHPDGTIDTTNNNRIYPVFWDLETLDLDDGESAKDREGHPLFPDREILFATLGLRAPISIGGDADLAHTVLFPSLFHRLSFAAKRRLILLWHTPLKGGTPAIFSDLPNNTRSYAPCRPCRRRP